jgi:hypothetical protein
MVKYNVALFGLMTFSLSSSSSSPSFCDAFSNSRIRSTPSLFETSTTQLYISVSSPLDDGNTKNGFLHETVESLGETISEAAIREEVENLKDEEQLELKKQQVRERQQNKGTVSQTWLVQVSFAKKIGITVATPFDKEGKLWRSMNLDSLQSYNQKIESFVASDTSVDAASLQRAISSKDKKDKIIVVSMDPEGQGWQNGIRPGDIILASSATVGDVSSLNLSPFYFTWISN